MRSIPQLPLDRDLRSGYRALPMSLRDEVLHDLDFSVIAEDEDYVAIDKPSHLLVHPTSPNHPSTLWDELRGLLAFEIANGGQISIITRLDRETSGIVLVAKHHDAASRAGLAMQNGEFDKRYQALVHGWPDREEWTVDSPLRRKGEFDPSPIWVKQAAHPDGKPSCTEFRTSQRFENRHGQFALIACHPLHGRMHQIRVHLADSGHPIVADKIYGVDETCYLDFIETGWTPDLERRLLINRHALHASELHWPAQDHHWSSPLPPTLQRFLTS